MKHCLVFNISSQSKLKLRGKWRNKIFRKKRVFEFCRHVSTVSTVIVSTMLVKFEYVELVVKFKQTFY